uniref:Transposase n=1 Tax=Strongyloides venezuelensis TaxID=75913 RepID=A0A0K0FUX0_STRVS
MDIFATLADVDNLINGLTDILENVNSTDCHANIIRSFANFVGLDITNPSQIKRRPNKDFIHLAFQSPNEKDLTILRNIEK